MAPEEAARALSRRPARVRATLLAALDHWLILANFEKAPEAAWLKQVLSLADSDPWRQGVRSRARKMTARRWRSWHARSIPHSSRRKLVRAGDGVCNSEAPAPLPWRSCDAPSRHSRQTSGSTTTSGWR